MLTQRERNVARESTYGWLLAELEAVEKERNAARADIRRMDQNHADLVAERDALREALQEWLAEHEIRGQPHTSAERRARAALERKAGA